MSNFDSGLKRRKTTTKEIKMSLCGCQTQSEAETCSINCIKCGISSHSFFFFFSFFWWPRLNVITRLKSHSKNLIKITVDRAIGET